MIMDRSWFWRRWAVGSTIGFCMIIIGWSTLFAADTAIARDIVSSAFLLFGATLQGYVFGAIMDDRFKGKELIAHKAVERSDPATTATNVEVQQ